MSSAWCSYHKGTGCSRRVAGSLPLPPHKVCFQHLSVAYEGSSEKGIVGEDIPVKEEMMPLFLVYLSLGEFLEGFLTWVNQEFAEGRRANSACQA